MTLDWLARIESSDALKRLMAAVQGGGSVSVRGAAGSSTTVIAALAARSLRRPVLLVAAHIDEASEMVEEVTSLGVAAELFPAIEALPGESAAALDLVASRLRFVDRWTGSLAGSGETGGVIVAPIAALMQGVPDRATLPKLLRRLHRGMRLRRGELVEWLSDGGYRRGESIEQPGDFAVRGGLVDIFPPGGSMPVRLDFLGDELERLFEIDPATQASDRAVDEAAIVSASADSIQNDAGTVQPASILPRTSIGFIAELAEVTEQARGYWERVHDGRGVIPPPEVMKCLATSLHAIVDVNQFSAGNASSRVMSIPVRALPGFAEQVPQAFLELAAMAAEMPLVLLCDNEGESSRARELLAAHAAGAAVAVEQVHLHRGFIWGEPGGTHAIVPQHEVLHRWTTRRRAVAPAIGRAAAREAFLQFAPGDFVVHRDQGIALYAGLTRLPEARGGPDEEFLTLEFDGGARLHVPASRVDLIQKYVGAGGAKPKLSILGGKRWRNQKARVEEAVLDMAAELLRVQAVREASPGIRFPDDTEWQREFEAEFPYEETEDQLTAIAAVKRDMARNRPMDRLACGDVGFGKTEVAIRAAFKAVEFGKQVAVLVPTTVLAEQHERTFRERFAGYPFRIESLSRFKTAAEQRAILEDAAAGRVDVLIGTHRLLSADVRLKDLGLVVVDEEQRFGVEHKQRLLEFRVTADVLTLSATPIPRTLHMALLGLRDISSLTTPPLDRRAIVTEVIPWNDRRIQQAMRRELAREGQIFLVHNRVRTIERVADRVRDLVPEARVIVGHGQMSAGELEEVMLRFMRRDADVLVSTTIIESGIDIPTANTIIIDDAAIYGLADLHQLRGRVGRSSHRAYCYLLLHPDKVTTQDAIKRLKAIEDYSMLGAGFKIAMRDLEIRGAGNLLGAEQSGHIAAVGYEMYCQLLEDAVSTLARTPRPKAADVRIEIGLFGAIPRGFIPSDQRRLEAYRRIAAAGSGAELERIMRDLESAYGEVPALVRTLVDLAELRLLATAIGVRSIARRESDIVIDAEDPDRIVAAFEGVRGSVRLVEGQLFWRPEKSALEPTSLAAILRRRLRSAAPVAGV